jgi:hypothetical protein
MFVGHYGVSFAAKELDQTIPLWLLFIAVQWLDVVWAPLVLLGVERVRIVPGITASNPLDLYYMPYTHSLVAALLWSAAAFVFYRIVTGRKDAVAASVIAGAVFSHWVLDFVVHRPDLSGSNGIGICLGGRRRIGLLLRRLGDAIVRRACGGHNDASSRRPSTETRTGPTESAAHATRSVIQTGIAAVRSSGSQSQTSRPCRTLRCTRIVWPCSGCQG